MTMPWPPVAGLPYWAPAVDASVPPPRHALPPPPAADELWEYAPIDDNGDRWGTRSEAEARECVRAWPDVNRIERRRVRVLATAWEEYQC